MQFSKTRKTVLLRLGLAGVSAAALLVAGADPAPEDRRGFFRRAYDWLF
jgi:hypothetical protein